MVMLYILLSVLILVFVLVLAIVAIGCYFAALKWVELRTNRDMLADELKRAKEFIEELETRINFLEAERDAKDVKLSAIKGDDPTGWDSFNIRA